MSTMASTSGPLSSTSITGIGTFNSNRSIPPPEQTYEPLVKSVLRNRLLYNVFGYSALFSFALSLSYFGNGDSGLGYLPRLAKPGTWTLAAITWLVGVLPTILLRKVYLTGTSTLANAPSKALQTAFGKSSTRHSFAVYAVCAAFMAAVHVLLANFDNTSGMEQSRVPIFVKSRKHPYYLNGRFIYLMGSQLWLAGAYLLRNVMLDRFVFRFPSSSASMLGRRWAISAGQFATLVLTISLFVALSSGSYLLFFGFARSVVLPILFKVPLLHYVLRPFVAHFLRGSWTVLMPLRNFSQLWKAFSLGFVTLINWEFAEALFEVYIPQPVKSAQTTADPSMTLISGISSQDPLFKHLAYSELVDLTLDETTAATARRSALFTDQKYVPSLWGSLAREALLTLGRDYQLLLRRGKPAPPAHPTTVTKPATKVPDLPSTPLIHQPIFQTPRQSPFASVLDSLASDSQTPGAATEAAAAPAEVSTSHVPELFRSVIHTPATPKITTAPAVSAPATTQPVNTMKNMTEHVKGKGREVFLHYCPAPIKVVVGSWNDWWCRERVNKVVETCLPHRELDALIIEVLSRMVCASLTEDEYGVVQRDIPRILEAFLSFLSAIEEYQRDISAMYTPPSPDELSNLGLKELGDKERVRIEVARATEVFGVVRDALTAGVGRIVQTFGDKLLAFKFPPRTAKKLQGFVDPR